MIVPVEQDAIAVPRTAWWGVVRVLTILALQNRADFEWQRQIKSKSLYFVLTMVAGLLLPGHAVAHVSQQGLVLLLPTRFYIGSGVLVVLLTLALVALLPNEYSKRLFGSLRLWVCEDNQLRSVTSVLSTGFLFFLIYLGFTASYDPLENPLPVFIWTVWWVGFVVLQGLFGNLWVWLNPWSGVASIASRAGLASKHSLPESVQQWPAIIIFLAFISFSLADSAPEAPQRLAVIVTGYWCFTMLGVLLFGVKWLQQAECFTVLLNRFAQIAPVAKYRDELRFGLPGWNLVRCKATTVSAAVFILVLLACGSFDGLNETFLWLATIGVNPLDFPGRSAIVFETVAGLLIANVALVTAYSLCIYTGLLLANRDGYLVDSSVPAVAFKQAFCALAVAVVPIAFVYHFAHFLTSFMVNIQYAVAAASDPFDNGADLLGLGSYYVTTGFFNTPQSVKIIWLSQAGAVVVGHVLSVLIAHAIAVELFGSARRAIVSQVPLAVFMVVYTFIGLWLLAAPKGA